VKIRFFASLCIGLLLILLIGNNLFENNGLFTSGTNVEKNYTIKNVKWNLSTKKRSQTVEIQSKSISTADRDKMKVFISTNELNNYKILDTHYNGNNSYIFTYPFKKKVTYYISLFLDNTTVGTKVYNSNKDYVQDLFPSSILTKKSKDFQVSLLFTSLIPKEKSTITFSFNDFKSKNPKLSNHRIYVVSDDGKYFKVINNQSSKKKISYHLTFPKEGMYKIFYEFDLSNKNETFNYILDVKDKIQ
jgi:hypothetical protein